MKPTLLYLITASVLILNAFHVKAQVNKNDSLALVNLHDSTGGNDPAFWYTDWDLHKPVATWFGISIENKRVIAINLKNNFIVGSIPSSIGNITRLSTLDLSYNFIKGTLPATIGNLINLETIDIGRTSNGPYYSDITGSIPASFSNLVNLKYLNLSYTRINGNLPAFISASTMLQTLNLSNTSITGNIPKEYGNFKYLQIFDLSNTYINGQLPVSLCKLHNLTTFNLYNDQQLGGKLPDSLFNAAITYLNFSNCGFQGKLPSSFDLITKARFIDLSRNQFSGLVPTFNFPDLTYFDFSYNRLQGLILSSFASAANLQTVILKNNAFSGKIPAALFNLAQLQTLDLSFNSFSGTLPTLIQTLNLESLYLNNNQFSGQIPQAVGNLNNLRYLYLNNNNFSGLVPTSIGNLMLYDFNIAYNSFTAPFPVLNNYPYTYSINNNHFNFSGLENFVGNMDSLAGNVGTYAPQASIPIHYSNKKLSVSAGGKLGNNTYKWYKNNNLVATTTGDSTFNTTGAGQYSVSVTNTIAKALILYSDTIIIPASSLKANEILSLQQNNKILFSAVVAPNPIKGNTINLVTNSGSFLPIIIKILNVNGTIIFKTPVEINAGSTTHVLNLKSLPAGVYFLKIYYNNTSTVVQFIKA